MPREKKPPSITAEQQLKARQRGEYHQIAQNIGKCVFCDLRPKYIIDEDSGLVLTVNLFPYIDGHLLVVPKRHLENYLDLTEEEVLANHRLTRKALQLLREKLGIDGIWLVLRDGQNAEKTVQHLHWQVMPYISGLNEWYYQKITLSPEKLAKILRGKT